MKYKTKFSIDLNVLYLYCIQIAHNLRLKTITIDHFFAKSIIFDSHSKSFEIS